MNKAEAIATIKEITCGCWEGREFPDEMKGAIAKKRWNDDLFSYGMEYGVIQGLMIAFDISVEDIQCQPV